MKLDLAEAVAGSRSLAEPSPERDGDRFCDVAQAALVYAAWGWPVVPLHHPTLTGAHPRCSCPRGRSCTRVGKHPRTRNGVNDASTDPDRIRRWWADWPQANVAIATGGDSGLLVLDVDPRHDGRESLRRLQAEHAPLPQTARVATGSGGTHLYFTARTGRVRNSAGRLGPGLDIRTTGGLTVAPPSLHATGRRYRWENP